MMNGNYDNFLQFWKVVMRTVYAEPLFLFGFLFLAFSLYDKQDRHHDWA